MSISLQSVCHWLALRPAGSDVAYIEDAVVDRPSSAGLQDNRSLLPGQVSQVKNGIGEAGRLFKDVGGCKRCSTLLL